MKKFIKILKRPFCKHKYMPNGYFFDLQEDGTRKQVHIWTCTKCGKDHINDNKGKEKL